MSGRAGDTGQEKGSDHDSSAGEHRHHRGGQAVEAGAGARTERRGRLLIFIVAYNAERTIEDVLRRIPTSLAERYEVEVLIIDDSSKDDTFFRSELANRRGIVPFKLTVLFNPVNQGYGGNQKIGFHYAIENGFDWVALVHGDGQYAPECLPDLVAVLAGGEAEAVFGSRMLDRGGALRGGMPLYKYVGNKILTRFQNLLLGTRLSEFHSGYRLYATRALAAVPFDLNSNDFHFDTEIIIQFVIARLRIRELPIPTFYGDEVCHVNGLHYAWNVCWTTLQARVQRYHIFYDRKFDCAVEPPPVGEDRLGFLDRQVLARVAPDSRVLVIGTLAGPSAARARGAQLPPGGPRRGTARLVEPGGQGFRLPAARRRRHPGRPARAADPGSAAALCRFPGHHHHPARGQRGLLRDPPAAPARPVLLLAPGRDQPSPAPAVHPALGAQAVQPERFSDRHDRRRAAAV